MLPLLYSESGPRNPDSASTWEVTGRRCREGGVGLLSTQREWQATPRRSSCQANAKNPSLTRRELDDRLKPPASPEKRPLRTPSLISQESRWGSNISQITSRSLTLFSRLTSSPTGRKCRKSKRTGHSGPLRTILTWNSFSAYHWPPTAPPGTQKTKWLHIQLSREVLVKQIFILAEAELDKKKLKKEKKRNHSIQISSETFTLQRN